MMLVLRRSAPVQGLPQSGQVPFG